MGQTEIYQHFNREDHEFIDRCIELSERVVERYSVEVTGFFKPSSGHYFYEMSRQATNYRSLLPVMSRKWSMPRLLLLQIITN